MTRRVLVTGGTSGIGWAIAEAFAGEGCQVVVTGRTAEEAAQISPTTGISARQLDVTQPAQIAAIIADMQSLDVLVNAAGIILRNQQEHNPEAFARVIDVT
jgi:NAD(P)-dependent dehydrogenase (short-subunit alcohol dehydrogenase family)